MTAPTLLAIPNVSEGRDPQAIAAIGVAFAGGLSSVAPDAPQREASDAALVVPDATPRAPRLLDTHSDPDHHRTVYTLAGPPGALADGLLQGIAAAIAHVDVMSRAGGAAAQIGQHPHVGAVDVVPLVYLNPDARGAACAEALVVADRIGSELQVPVFLYGELSGEDPTERRTRADLRRGGVLGLAERMAAPHAHLAPDFGPPRMHPTAGATLVAARPPLVAFNLQLAAPATLADARAIAARIREGGAHGLPGLRAIGVELTGGVAQVSMNVERPFDVSLATVVDAVRAHAPVASAELVGLAPAAAFDGFPEDVPIPGFDPARHLIENALG
jgi:glutamate formiminotransferase / 5-formyltetrahydrofolate cyclo-ligase